MNFLKTAFLKLFATATALGRSVGRQIPQGALLCSRVICASQDSNLAQKIELELTPALSALFLCSIYSQSVNFSDDKSLRRGVRAGAGFNSGGREDFYYRKVVEFCNATPGEHKLVDSETPGRSDILAYLLGLVEHQIGTEFGITPEDGHFILTALKMQIESIASDGRKYGLLLPSQGTS